MTEGYGKFQVNLCSLLCQMFPARIADQSEDLAKLHRYGPPVLLANVPDHQRPDAQHTSKGGDGFRLAMNRLGTQGNCGLHSGMSERSLSKKQKLG